MSFAAPIPRKWRVYQQNSSFAAAAAHAGLPTAYLNLQIELWRPVWGECAAYTVPCCAFYASLAAVNPRKWWVYPWNRAHVASVTRLTARCGDCRCRTGAWWCSGRPSVAGGMLACRCTDLSLSICVNTYFTYIWTDMYLHTFWPTPVSTSHPLYTQIHWQIYVRTYQCMSLYTHINCTRVYVHIISHSDLLSKRASIYLDVCT